MADINSNAAADILSLLQGYTNASAAHKRDDTALLKSIDTTLKSILNSGSNISQSNIQNMQGSSRSASSYFRDSARGSRSNSDFKIPNGKGLMKDFSNTLKKALKDELLGEEFKKSLNDIRDTIAKDLGVEVDDIIGGIGRTVIKNVLSNNPGISNTINNWRNRGVNYVQSRYTSSRDAYFNRHGINPIRLPSRNPSQSEVGAGGIPGASNLSSTASVKNIIINANKVKVYKKSQNSNSNSGDNDNPDRVSEEYAEALRQANSQVSEFLNNRLGEGASDLFSEEQLSQLSESLAGGAGAGDITALLSGFAGDNSNIANLLGGADDIANIGQSLTATMGAGAGASGALAGLTSVLGGLIPQIALVTGGMLLLDTALDYLKKSFMPAIEGTKKLIEATGDALDRYNESQSKQLEESQKRIEADVKTLVETPFKILEDAAQSLYDAWDNNIRTINATQGYDKDDLHSLIGSFAERLRQEDLTKVVSTADITNNLTKVLESGLSGTVAEEFAYLATKLNAAVPTQDFFSYVDTYASIAATAIQQGKSEAEAIEYANQQLEAFAGNILYANREISGGFTTGLKDASTLFAQAAQIAQVGRTNDVTNISGVLTAVSAIVGGVAPDLATSMVDAIYRASVGGNSTELVALRSLAGINASNTEFLKQISTNPKTVFTELFKNLADMQTMSQDAYMEVAEGLSTIFGVSIDTFARVDFAYLAQAISEMNTTNSALSSNMALLVSGETTTNAEQLRMQQINEYMLEEGLAYVLDNEAARAIQEHMWDEQIARELMEATYGVELQGAALEFLEGIRHTIDNILGFLNPFSWIGKIVDLVGSAVEAEAQEADIKQLLELGKVGKGNSDVLYGLTTRDVDLNLTNSLVDSLGGTSAYESVSGIRSTITGGLRYTSPWNLGLFDSSDKLINELYAVRMVDSSKSSSGFSGNSVYSWGSIGKSVASSLFNSVGGVPSAVGINNLIASNAELANAVNNQHDTNGNINDMLSSMSSYFDEVGAEQASYEDWVSTASQFGITDFNKALESAGLTESAVKGQFDSYSTEAAAEEKLKRDLKEETFWEDTVNELLNSNNLLQNIFDSQKKFFEDMVNYFIEHTVYKKAYDHSSVSEIQKKEKKESESAVYALADALTKNSVDLLDPTMQTNALLAQILKVACAIMEQNNTGVSTSLADTLAGLSLGIT